ncbi:MAG: hypothetical protein N3G77_07860 [Nitrososphaeria archaeon]|nr:hypothetical protein [Nitrososphaeria archaeon]
MYLSRMVEVYFRESGCLRSRRAGNIYFIMVISLIVLTISGMIAPMFGLAFVFGYPNEETVAIFLGMMTVLAISLISFTISLVKYNEASRVEVRDDGFLLGDRMVKWDEIEDLKTWSETYEDLEVEGGPAIGYGMQGYGYGYVPSRSVTRRLSKYVNVQIFHQNMVDEIRFSPREFWRFVKAVIRATRDKRAFLADKNWLQKLERLDKIL